MPSGPFSDDGAPRFFRMTFRTGPLQAPGFRSFDSHVGQARVSCGNVQRSQKLTALDRLGGLRHAQASAALSKKRRGSWAFLEGEIPREGCNWELAPASNSLLERLPSVKSETQLSRLFPQQDPAMKLPRLVLPIAKLRFRLLIRQKGKEQEINYLPACPGTGMSTVALSPHGNPAKLEIPPPPPGTPGRQESVHSRFDSYAAGCPPPQIASNSSSALPVGSCPFLRQAWYLSLFEKQDEKPMAKHLAFEDPSQVAYSFAPSWPRLYEVDGRRLDVLAGFNAKVSSQGHDCIPYKLFHCIS
ncbi:hypothetical protein V8C35DRAFT_97482 [Trichoderma chlorosporum]